MWRVEIYLLFYVCYDVVYIKSKQFICVRKGINPLTEGGEIQQMRGDKSSEYYSIYKGLQE